MTDSSIRKGSSKPSWSDSMFRIFTSMILVIFIAYFLEKPPAGFVCRSFLTKSWEIIYLLVTGIVVCYGLFGRRSVEKNEGMEISSDRLSMAYFAEIFNVDCVSDFGMDHGYADGGLSGNALMMRLGDEWLGLPVRSLKSLVFEDKGVKCGDGGFCGSRERIGSGSNCCKGVYEERNMTFGDLSPLNLLKKFNEASVLLSPIC
ncbi:unnamed protein product [Rhodiola kirilowii]